MLSDPSLQNILIKQESHHFNMKLAIIGSFLPKSKQASQLARPSFTEMDWLVKFLTLKELVENSYLLSTLQLKKRRTGGEFEMISLSTFWSSNSPMDFFTKSIFTSAYCLLPALKMYLVFSCLIWCFEASSMNWAYTSWLLVLKIYTIVNFILFSKWLNNSSSLSSSFTSTSQRSQTLAVISSVILDFFTHPGSDSYNEGTAKLRKAFFAKNPVLD